MTALERWLKREQRRQGRRPELLSALIAGRGLAYARHRLGFMVLRLLVRTALHMLEVLFLSRALPFEYLAPLLGYRALASLATNLHWGATESLREEVRTAARARKPALARAAIEAWLRGCSLLALAPLVFILVRIARSAAADGGIGLSLFDAYAFACAFRLFGEVCARTYHAGVFALRRVYRPLSTLLLADLLEVGLILACFDALGPWSIPLSILLGGSIDVAFTLRYARAAYLRHRMLLPRWSAVVRGRLRPHLSTIERALAHALAGASLQLDAWLLLLLIRVDPPRRAAPSLALLYYVLRPLLGLATHWVRTFYFDLIHLDAG
ncbi:MAG TPA: hypothetical protein VHZ95_04405, partial [Polyangiales bacterium]|nr:hypothetical protein [Polyangiales bacterium]